MSLIDDTALERSAVVANSAMNRERGLLGVNSYARELRFDPMEFLFKCLDRQDRVSWLDLCCGTGKALIEAAEQFEERGLAPRISLLGIDLVDMFLPVPRQLSQPVLKVASLRSWHPKAEYDLVTCVHGLHYIGDKLRLIERIVSRLTSQGTFMANFDGASLHFPDGRSMLRSVARVLRQQGLRYDTRNRILSCQGPREAKFPFEYLGADDQAGPNYTGQPAVESYYRPVQKSGRGMSDHER